MLRKKYVSTITRKLDPNLGEEYEYPEIISVWFDFLQNKNFDLISNKLDYTKINQKLGILGRLDLLKLHEILTSNNIDPIGTSKYESDIERAKTHLTELDIEIYRKVISGSVLPFQIISLSEDQVSIELRLFFKKIQDLITIIELKPFTLTLRDRINDKIKRDNFFLQKPKVLWEVYQIYIFFYYARIQKIQRWLNNL